jgi:hypothetical protein
MQPATNTTWIYRALLSSAFIAFTSPLYAQCASGDSLTVLVTDSSGAALPATVHVAGNPGRRTDAVGNIVLPCVVAGGVDLTIDAPGFESLALHASKPAGGEKVLRVKLAVAQVTTSITVDAIASSPSRQGGADSLDEKQLQGLASDPDEFKRQLLALASAGSSPSAVTISVDSFQESGTIPPKESILSVKANADPFAAEWANPIIGGGRLDITTKPGSRQLHGSAFVNSSASAFNAGDPYSTAAAPAGNQNVGASLTGPLTLLKSGYGVSLQHRAIREQSVVNAVGLSSTLTPTPLLQTVSAPQVLWIGDLRAGWQVAGNDLVTTSLTANVNDGQNQGVGGLILQQAGYTAHTSEYALRIANNQTFGASLLHQSRIGFTWRTVQQTPLSQFPSLNVAGSFLGGGSTQGDLLQKDHVLEVDESLEWNKGRFDLKGGIQILSRFLNDRIPSVFNGAFVFGGGSAPALDVSGIATGQQTTITPLEQYGRTLAMLPGGTPTTYQVTTGSANTRFDQYQQAFYVQANVQLSGHVTLQAGLRYQLQTAPLEFNNFQPRAGLAWSPTGNSRLTRNWSVSLSAGLFAPPLNYRYARDISLLDGVHAQQLTIYSPQFTQPTALVPGSIEVTARRQFSPNIRQDTFMQTQTTLERGLGSHWVASATLVAGQDWRRAIIRNINAPLLGMLGGSANPTAALLAPRPFGGNQNIFEYQSTGHLIGILPEFRISAHGYKRGSFDLRYSGMRVHGDANQVATSPQSTYSKAGESSRPDFQIKNALLFNGSLGLPGKLKAGAEFDYGTGVPFNIATGTDANGDGYFNDRPSYAPVGDTADAANGIYATRYGLLSTDTTNGSVPRNLGTMPALAHLSVSLRRDVPLTHRQDNRTLTLSLRSSNVINHTNVTAVGTVLGGASFDQGVAAEPARRVELGARVNF